MPDAGMMAGGGAPSVAPQSQEPTQDAPSPELKDQQLLAQFGKKLIDLTTRRRSQWEWKRRGIVLKVLKNKEMLKGNQHMGVYPGTFDTFDALEEYSNWAGGDEKNGDKSMDRRPHNFYQMLEKAFVAALGAQIPKTRWTPANADDEADRETAKVASRAEEIIERANKIKSMLKQELMEFFTGGCYFKFTRYVVDADRTGTHKETMVSMTKAEVLPARYQCFNCGVSTPESALVAKRELKCPNCGTPFSGENYFEDHIEDIPQAEEQTDVPNGMVLWNIYGPMHVDADPDAPDLLNTCLLNVAEEVSVGWLRTTFEELWERFEEGQNSGTGSELLERQYRDLLTTAAGTSSWFSFASQNRPTYNRTWIQPMLFAEMEDKNEAKQLMQQFPKGCMLAWTGDIPLFIRPAKLTDEWTWAGTEQKGFGLFPAPAGDPAVPIQERINDCVNKIDEYIDRLACGILLANEQYIDTRAMNGKPMLPGLLNPVTMRKGAPPGDIQNMIFQVRGEIDAIIFNYLSSLKQDMELLVGTPPQTFGAGTQEGVETKGGQEQQLNTGLMKLGLHWEVIGDEHAEAAENAIKCAALNMTDDWLNTVADQSKEWRTEYVHIDQMKGTVHAERDTEQGFPMTAAEIRAFWQQIVENPENPFVQLLLDEPENVDNAIRFIGVPGLKAPKGTMRGKMLRQIAQLVEGQPVQAPDPVTGEPTLLPSIQPSKYLDDLPTLIKLIPAWSAEHWDQLESNQPALDNLVAFYKQCVVYERELAAELQMTRAAPQGQPQPTA
jgi:hypothetical protein